jgi:hypothetical protein
LATPRRGGTRVPTVVLMFATAEARERMADLMSVTVRKEWEMTHPAKLECGL